MTIPRCRPLAALFALVAATSALRADVLLVGDALQRSTELNAALRAEKLTATPADASALRALDPARANVVVLAPAQPLPPDSRRALTRFLAAGGHAVVIGANAFNYAPQPTRPVPLGRFADADSYRVVPRARPSAPRPAWVWEPARRETVRGPDGDAALAFRTYLRGMDDFLVELDATAARSAKRSVLRFWAKGDAYMDLLAIEIRDTDGQKWLGFVPLRREWQHHAISLADFMPEGWDRSDEPYPLLRPETVATIGLGTNLATLWPEKPMAFTLGSVDLAEDASGVYAPTSALPVLRLPFLENGMKTPTWLFDPFAGSERIHTTMLRRADDGGATLDLPLDAWLCPTPNVEHPGPRMGTDHRKDYILKFERELRRIPLWEALGEKEVVAGPVAELRIAAAGKRCGASVAIFGLPAEKILGSPALLQSLVETIAMVAARPKVAGVTINTTSAQAGSPDAVPTLSVVVQNPLAHAVQGKLVATVADGKLRGETSLTVPARGTATATVALSAVPADFPFARFDWRVAFESDAGRDELHDRVDLERGLIHASRHMVGTQRQFPDGRISHHYFGDAYGARAMIAYADFLRRHPKRLKANADLWRTISPAELDAGGRRFFDMLVRRQNEDGSVPMGYGEHTHVYNIADTGSMALGAGQVATLINDPVRREDLFQFCRSFADWAETFYIDEKRSAELAAKYPDRARKGETAVGHYGIGLGRLTRTETGPKWVLPDILAAQILLTRVDLNPDYARIADRNIRAYVDAGYSLAGYFHAEAMIWALLTTQDAGLRRSIAENLRATFIGTLLKGEANDMYQRGARAFLNGLPLLYYRQFVEDNAAVRALVLKYAWSFASENAPNAMRRVAETFPKPAHGESIAASKQASCGAIWAMELLEPGSSLLRGEFAKTLAAPNAVP